MVPECNAIFNFGLASSYSKNFKLVCCLRGVHLQIALNLLKYAIFIDNACMPCLSYICFDLITSQAMKSQLYWGQLKFYKVRNKRGSVKKRCKIFQIALKGGEKRNFACKNFDHLMRLLSKDNIQETSMNQN